MRKIKSKKFRAFAIMSSIMMIYTLSNPGTAIASSETEAIQRVMQTIDDNNMDTLQEIASELGIGSIESFIYKQLSRTSPPVPQSRIKNLDGIGGADVNDATYILNFLKGQVIYSGDYNDMDATADYVIDAADATAYLAYYVYCITNNISLSNNYSAPGSGSAPSTSYETITYEKHIVGSDTTRTNDTTYIISSGTNNESLSLETEELFPFSNIITAPFEKPMPFEILRDTPTRKRIVKNAGSGSIIGEHLILTDAHCLFDLSNNRYNTEYQAVYQGLDNNHNPTFHIANMISYHIPELYFTYGDCSRYDYAIVVVQDNLISDYNCEKFSLGLALDGAYSNGTNVKSESFCNGNTPILSSGTISSLLNSYIIESSAYTNSGGSGSPLYTETEFDDEEYESEIGIVCSMTQDGSGAIRVIRPILQFCFNNPNL